MPWILLHQTWQMNLLWLMNPTSTRAEMTCIPQHQSWKMNLLWPMNLPQYKSRDDLHTTTQNLDRWTYFAWTQWQRFESSSVHHFWDTPQHFLKTQFCLKSGFLSLLELQKSPLVSRVIENWYIEYCYTKPGRWTYFGQWTAPITRVEMTCIPLHKTWQMNLLWLMNLPPVLATEMTCIPLAFKTSAE